MNNFVKNTLGATLILILSIGAKAQIVYTDIIPDTTISATTTEVSLDYEIDFNKDDDIDIMFRHFNPDLSMISVELYVKGNYILCDNSGAPMPLANSIGRYLGDTSSNWNLYSIGMTNMYDVSEGRGYWNDVQDKYLGVKFDIGGSYHYGWIRLDVAADAASFTVKDYAYEATTLKSMLAGESTSSSINIDNNKIPANIRVFTNGKNLVFNSNYSNTVKGELKLYNIQGKEVSSFSINSNTASFPIEKLERGIYLLKGFVNNEVVSTKIIVE